MKLHSETIPAQAMAPYQTPATAPSTWRADLARIGIVCGLVFVIGAFATGTAVLLWQSWQTVGIGLWLTGLVIVGYLAWYAWSIHSDVSARNRLDRARMRAEHDALTTVDLNQDGKADASEVDAFVRYVERIHRPGASTTADFAQKHCGVTGPDWTRYKRWLIRNGYADQVRRRGGDGFVLKPSVLKTPWPKMEQELRKRVRLGLGLAADGRTFDPDDVSTLGKG